MRDNKRKFQSGKKSEKKSFSGSPKSFSDSKNNREQAQSNIYTNKKKANSERKLESGDGKQSKNFKNKGFKSRHQGDAVKGRADRSIEYDGMIDQKDNRRKKNPFETAKKRHEKNPRQERSRNKDHYRASNRENRFVSKPSKHFTMPDDEKMPLNKFIAHAGVCSRRDAVNLIKNGEIKVNNLVVKEPGYKISHGDKVFWKDQRIYLQEKLVYILLNKPKGYITTTDDPKGRRTVMDIFKYHINERIYPVGRLDRNTTGLLLLTNDGQLTQKLAHPKYEVKKVYQVTLDKGITTQDIEKIKQGLVLEDGPIEVDQIEILEEPNSVGVEIHSGRNRIVRRIFESLGYVVVHLDRVMYADLTKKNLPRGKWRILSKQEVINLKFLNK